MIGLSNYKTNLINQNFLSSSDVIFLESKFILHFVGLKMNHILVVPLKKTSDVDITRPLKTWINSTFNSNERPQDLTNALSELQKLRQKSVKSNDLTENGLTTIGM